MSAPAPPVAPIPASHAPVRAALLGSGLFATNSYLPSLLLVPGLEVSTVWSRSSSSAEKLAAKAVELGGLPNVPQLDAQSGEEALDAILDDPEVRALVMVLPIGVQPGLIRRAWAKGKHVISEKPVGRSVAEATALVEEYEREWKPKGLVWRVAENFAHEPHLQLASRLLSQPSVGSVLFWRMHFGTMLPAGASYHATPWRTVPDYAGGFLLDGGVHWAAVLRCVLPPALRPVTLTAHKALHRAHMLPHDTLVGLAQPAPAATGEPKGERTAVAGTLRPEDMPVPPGRSAPVGSFTLSWALPDTPRGERVPNELYVVCEHATLNLTNLGRGWRVELRGEEGGGVQDVCEEGPVSGVARELAEFAAAVAGEGGENRGEPRAALWDVGFVMAALESDGKPTRIGVEL